MKIWSAIPKKLEKTGIALQKLIELEGDEQKILTSTTSKAAEAY